MYGGIDIGGSKILVAVGDDKGDIVESRVFPTPADADSGLEAVRKHLRRLAGDFKLQAIGVAAPGPLDLPHGKMLNPFNMHWRNIEIVKRLKLSFKVPVILENDANAAGLYEALQGAGRGQRHVLYVTVSTGIGTGMVIDGKIYRGAHDTEGGHMLMNPLGPICHCGKHGHFEAMASGTAVKFHYDKFGFEITDPDIWDEIAHDLAMGLYNLATVLSPDIIVLGGGLSVHWHRFKEPLLKHFKELESVYPLPKIVIAKRIETAAVSGALLLAGRALDSTKRKA